MWAVIFFRNFLFFGRDVQPSVNLELAQHLLAKLYIQKMSVFISFLVEVVICWGVLLESRGLLRKCVLNKGFAKILSHSYE